MHKMTTSGIIADGFQSRVTRVCVSRSPRPADMAGISVAANIPSRISDQMSYGIITIKRGVDKMPYQNIYVISFSSNNSLLLIFSRHHKSANPSVNW
jgi:hypothetical protein